MLNEEDKKLRQKNIVLHKNKDTKHRAYLIKLSDEQYHRLKEMSGNKTMSSVINQGMKDQWIYYSSVKKLMNKLPKFETVDQIERWRLEHLKDSPAMVSKYVSAAAIMTYVSELQKARLAENSDIDNQETIAYLLKTISNNINQLARRSNSGVDVPKEELRNVTKAVIKLTQAIKDTRKGVT